MSTYPTQRAAWLIILLWGIAGFCAWQALTVHEEPVAPWMKVFATCFFAACALLVAGVALLAYHTDYSIDPESLTIRVGPLRTRIPLAEIVEVFPTRNPLSAPAWSLDRLQVRTRTRKIAALISPERPQQFLAEMAAQAPHLLLEGGRLSSRPQE